MPPPGRLALVYGHWSAAGRPWNPYVGAEQHDEADHRVDVAEPAGDPDQQLYLVVQHFDPGVAHAVVDGVEDVLAVSPDLPLKIHERGDAASLSVGRPSVQARRGGFRVVHVQDQAKLLLQDMRAVHGPVLGLYHGKPFPLPVREVLRVLPERVLRAPDLLRSLLRGLCRVFRGCVARSLLDGFLWNASGSRGQNSDGFKEASRRRLRALRVRLRRIFPPFHFGAFPLRPMGLAPKANALFARNLPWQLRKLR